MNPVISIPLSPADPETFRGTAFSGAIAAAESDVAVKLFWVRFEPDARTNWHAHSGEQILLVTSGRCRYQIDGEPIREIGAGESIRFDPGVRHWHGASASEAAEHIAINIANERTSWFEPVSDPDDSGIVVG